MQTKTIHKGPLSNPAGVVAVMNGLPGQPQVDPRYPEPFIVERVLQFQAVPAPDGWHLIALVEVRE